VKGLIYFESQYVNHPSVRSMLTREVFSVFSAIFAALFVFAAVYAFDIWELGNYLPENWQAGANLLVRPLGFILAVGLVMQGIDSSCMRRGDEEETGFASGILLIASFLMWFLEVATLAVCALLLWDMSVALMGNTSLWTSELLSSRDTNAYLSVAIHSLVVWKVAMLFAATKPIAALLIGLLLLPAAAIMSMLRFVLDRVNPDPERLSEFPGVQLLVSQFGTGDYSSDVLLMSGLIHLGFFALLVSLCALASYLFRSRFDTLDAIVERQESMSELARGDTYAKIPGHANQYRVIDPDNYEYFNERTR
jgi:hypothetical protein